MSSLKTLLQSIQLCKFPDANIISYLKKNQAVLKWLCSSMKYGVVFVKIIVLQ